MSCNEWCSSKNEGQVQRFKSCSDRWDAPRRKRSIIADICHSAMNPFNDASIDRSTSGLIKAPLVLIDHYAFTQSLFTADSWWTIFAFFFIILINEKLYTDAMISCDIANRFAMTDRIINLNATMNEKVYARMFFLCQRKSHPNTIVCATKYQVAACYVYSYSFLIKKKHSIFFCKVPFF